MLDSGKRGLSGPNFLKRKGVPLPASFVSSSCLRGTPQFPVQSAWTHPRRVRQPQVEALVAGAPLGSKWEDETAEVGEIVPLHLVNLKDTLKIPEVMMPENMVRSGHPLPHPWGT